MKRAILLAMAVALLLSSNAWVLVSVWRNRQTAAGGTAELTEHELALPPMAGDSTALLLQLKWEAASSDPENERSPDWLDAPKLAELGFDCGIPIVSPKARDHYASQPGRLAYVVLECASEALPKPGHGDGLGARLIAVDAARDPRSLRKEYPDLSRHMITRGVVRLSLEDQNRRSGQPLPEPRLRGWLETLVPNQVFVPKPYCRMLQGLRPRDDSPRAAAGTEPRFTVTVSWGADYEPWIREVRFSPPATAAKP